MEVEVKKENMCINKLVYEKKELIFVEEDMIVPDSKPDILNIINLSGNVCIYKNESMEEKLKLEGSINTYIMYVPDSKTDNLRGLNANINFSQMINIPNAREDMYADTDITTKYLECKILNGRKINIKATLEANIRLYENKDIAIINKISNIEDVQILEKIYDINSLIGSGNARAYAKDTLNIDKQDEILEILKADVKLIDSDIKISYNKIISKCEAEIKIMYLTQDNRINTIDGKIPAVSFINIQNISEENVCDIKNIVKNILVKANPSEEHSIYVEIEVETNCMCYEKKQVNIMQDAYSPSVNLELEQNQIIIMNKKETQTKTFTLTSKINIPDLAGGSLIDVEIMSNIDKEEKAGENIIYGGELSLNFIFTLKDTNTVNSKISKIPFEFEIENPYVANQIDVNTIVLVSDKNFVVKQNGDVECSINMDFITEFYENISLDVIENIEANESEENTKEDYDSLIIYIVQPGDSLWKIAKKFKSTVTEIAVMNGIEDKDKIDIGQKLYIPKFNYSLKAS